jgi:tetratricopeptide (TPR) repeat protein
MILPIFLLFSSFSLGDVDKSLTYHNKMADIYFHKGNYPEMIYHLNEKAKLDPKNVENWSDLSYYYWSMSVNEPKRKDEFWNKSLNSLKKGLEYNKESFYFWDEIGKFYISSKKDYSTAINYLNEAINKKDVDNISFHILAKCYLETNDVSKAINILLKCLEKFPNDAKAKADLKRFND